MKIKLIMLILGILLIGCDTVTYDHIKESCIGDSPEQGLFCQCLAMQGNGRTTIDGTIMSECDKYLKKGCIEEIKEIELK